MPRLRRSSLVVAIALAGTVGVTGCSGSGSHNSAKTSASGGAANSRSVKPGTKLTIAFSGDDIPQEEIISAAHARAGGKGYDFFPLLKNVKPFISGADLSICQMEGTLSPNDTNLTQGLRHHGPKEFATAIKKVGYAGCSTANNHTFDAGVAGLAQTRDVMAQAGLKASGPGPSATSPGMPQMYNINGVKVAHLSYSYTLDNFAEGSEEGFPASAPWIKSSLWKARGAAGIEADARAARKAGAQIVLVSMHWGTMNDHNQTPDMTQTAQEVMKSGAVDVIIGNHAHVVEQCSRVNGRMIFYGLGNQLSNQDHAHWGFPDATQDGVMVKMTFTPDGSGNWKESGIFQPTRVDVDGGYVVNTVTSASNKTSYDRTSQYLEGNHSCGLTPGS